MWQSEPLCHRLARVRFPCGQCRGHPMDLHCKVHLMFETHGAAGTPAESHPTWWNRIHPAGRTNTSGLNVDRSAGRCTGPLSSRGPLSCCLLRTTHEEERARSVVWRKNYRLPSEDNGHLAFIPESVQTLHLPQNKSARRVISHVEWKIWEKRFGTWSASRQSPEPR